jgi:hypothetical protein
MGALSYRNRPRFHLTIQEAAARFNVDAAVIAAGIRVGKLRSRRAMHRSWVTPSAVALYLDRERRYVRHAPWNTVPPPFPWEQRAADAHA